MWWSALTAGDYLQLQGIPAMGLTIDELRARFDDELARVLCPPRTIVVPASFNSKKYFILGKVVTEGAFVLDRAADDYRGRWRAPRGFQTGAGELSSTEVADLSRSFLVREEGREYRGL